MTLKTVIEALIFGSPKPLTTKEIAAALAAAGDLASTEEAQALSNAGEAPVKSTLEAMQAEYVDSSRGFRLLEQVNGWTLVTNPEAAPWVKQLYPEAKPTRLSGPALETLAIIAYRQPVTRADVEAVRGVAVDGVMQVLLDRGLVKITGRADVPGRPLLYGTTEYFLQHFGLKTTDELPNSSELKRVPLPTAPLEEEAVPSPKKGRKQKEAAPEAPVQPPSMPPAAGESPASEDAAMNAESAELPAGGDEPSAEANPESLEEIIEETSAEDSPDSSAPPVGKPAAAEALDNETASERNPP